MEARHAAEVPPAIPDFYNVAVPRDAGNNPQTPTNRRSVDKLVDSYGGDFEGKIWGKHWGNDGVEKVGTSLSHVRLQ